MIGYNKKARTRTTLSKFFLIIGMIMIFGVLCGCEEVPTRVPKETEPTELTLMPTEDPVFTVGDTVEIRDVYVTLIDVYEFSGEFMQPNDGNTFVAFELLIENKSSKSIPVSSLMCFETYFDDYSVNMNLGAQVESKKNQLDGEIAPGKKMTGVVCYEVPEDWTTAEINIDLGMPVFTFIYSK